MKLLAVGTNAKTVKGDKSSEYLTAIMYLSPHKDNDKGVNLCPKASSGCVKSCLFTAGRGRFNSVSSARRRKSEFFISDRQGFVSQLHKELDNFVKLCERRGKKPAVRLNGTSDILWERYIDMNKYPKVQFYDYTKFPSRPKTASNYHITYSRKETDDDATVKQVMTNGLNVAVVFANKALPESYLGFPVVDGDKTDLRFLDAKGVIVGLAAKGDAKKDTSGFVIHQEAV